MARILQLPMAGHKIIKKNLLFFYGVRFMLSVESIKEILRPVFKEYNVKNAVLFGSYAKGNATINSDVDICVDSGLKGLKFFGLLEDVVNVLKLPVDLIDISQIDRDSRVEKEIKNTGVKIYGD